MGNTDTKLNFRKAIVQLGNKDQHIDASDDAYWEQFWSDHSTAVSDVFALIPANEIRLLREENPTNLATLCYKATERLVRAVDNSCRTYAEQQAVLNCVRILTRILPYIFEDDEWKTFFWSSLPSGREGDDSSTPLAQSLLNAICDLLFCPDFTVIATRRTGPERAEELANIDSCELIWEAGVGFAHSPPKNSQLEQRRTELLKLLLTCFSETMYRLPTKSEEPNNWIAHFTSADNRHALPLFTSLLNTVCSYDPVGLGVPYNHFLFSDTMEPLVEACLQILIVTLDYDITIHSPSTCNENNGIEYNDNGSTTNNNNNAGGGSNLVVGNNIGTSGSSNTGNIGDNLFINYLSRVHRDEDFHFMLKGITRLLNNPLVQSYLPNSTKRLHCHQELLVFFWKICDYNKKFLYYVLKSSDVLDVLVPILYHLNDSRADQSRVGLMHIGVFILLLLSGERNFGVRLNKPYTATVPMDIPVFTGSHADLLITVFHKIIATGHQRLQPLFDCLLTILVNVSPYLKTLSMVAAVKLLHLLEAFSTPWFLFSAQSNHHLVFFLLEIFNNIIQYQFDGNSNLVYTIIRKRHVFHSLANLPSDLHGISKCLNNRKGVSVTGETVYASSGGGGASASNNVENIKNNNNVRKKPIEQQRNVNELQINSTDSSTRTTPTPVTDDEISDDSENKSDIVEVSMEGSKPALPAEPGTLKATLLETPDIGQMTERESAHPLSSQSAQLSQQHQQQPSTSALSTEFTEIVSINDNMEVLSNNIVHSETEPIKTISSPTTSLKENSPFKRTVAQRGSIRVASANLTLKNASHWHPTPEWVSTWRVKLPLQTIMRLLQVLVPQVEKICIDKGLTDESEILKFLQHGTLVGLLPVPHPILIRKYQANCGTTAWFRTYMWGVIYLRNVDPAIWYDTEVKLFEIQRV